MQALRAKLFNYSRHTLGVRNRRMWKRAAPGLGWFRSELTVHLVQLFGALVVRLQRVVVDRPAWRHTFHVLERLKVFAPQPIQHAAPELGVAADVVMRIRTK